MTYYCTLCLKDHDSGYKRHWKYRKIIEIPKDPQILERLEKLEKEVGTLIGILIHWKGFIDRKHPYADAYQPLFDDL